MLCFHQGEKQLFPGAALSHILKKSTISNVHLGPLHIICTIKSPRPRDNHASVDDVVTSLARYSNNNKLSVLKANKDMGTISRQRDRADWNQEVHPLYYLKTETEKKKSVR